MPDPRDDLGPARAALFSAAIGGLCFAAALAIMVAVVGKERFWALVADFFG